MIPNKQKDIYNTYLITSRKRQGKPFRSRKDFNNFEETPEYISTKKLDMFFTKYPHVNMQEFFNAPYELFPDTTYYDLPFYTSPRALKTYTLYQTKKLNALPDTDNQLFFIRSSLNFIYKYCAKNNISSIDEYFKSTTNDIHTFMLHLKDRLISIYVIFSKKEHEDIFNLYEKSVLSFMLGNMIDNIHTYRTRYYNATTAKKLVTTGFEKIQKLLNNS
tara:strand:+ start:234 stop:887 length:654 start_codon:yes stop_codon:yes gene_type:complete